MRFDDVIMGRRSIRGYKPDPVPRALIEEIVTLALRVPSSYNSQPWHLHVITGEPLERIRAGAVASAETLSRFWTEAESLGRLRHPNIVQVYDFGRENGAPYVVRWPAIATVPCSPGSGVSG